MFLGKAGQIIGKTSLSNDFYLNITYHKLQTVLKKLSLSEFAEKLIDVGKYNRLLVDIWLIYIRCILFTKSMH